MKMKSVKEILEMRGIQSGWIMIPDEDYVVTSADIYDCSVDFVYFSFNDDDSLNFEYQSNGKYFELYSDWAVDICSKAKIKGKGSVRHRQHILYCLEWFIKAACDERYYMVFDGNPFRLY